MKHHRLAATILALFVIVATAYNLANPLMEPPDEHFHYEYVHVLHHQRALPVVDPTGPLTELHQPPLYYTIVALLTPAITPAEFDNLTQPNPFWGYEMGQVGRDNKNQFLHDPAKRLWASPYLQLHLARLLSTLFGAGTIWLTYLIAREFVSQALAAGAMAMVAFTPNFLLTASAVNNDSLSIMLVALAVWIILRLAARDARPAWWQWTGLGLVMGLGWLIKVNMGPVMPVSAVLAGLLAWRHGDWRVFVTAGVILLGVVGLFAVPWALRNVRLYGEITGFGGMWEVWGRRESLTVGAWAETMGYIYRTFWATLGWGNVPVPDWVYRLLDLFVLGGVIGLIVRDRRRDEPLSVVQRDRLILVAIWVVATYSALHWYMRNTFAITGRQLYAILPVIALGIVAGWATLARLVARPADRARRQRVVAGAISAAMLLLAVGTWVGALLPAYSRSPRVEALPDSATPLNWQFGDVAMLRGVEVGAADVAPGETLDVTLYWEPLTAPDTNYTVFVQLLAADEQIVGGRDTYPGLGNDPTMYWQPGALIADTVPVTVQRGASGPVALDVIAGLYDLDSGERLPITAPDGTPVGQPTVAQVKLAGTDGPIPPAANLINRRFQQGVTLAAVELAAQGDAGETIPVVLYWQPSRPLSLNYTVFVHLVSAEGEIVTQGDGPPKEGHYPTRFWDGGETIRDPHTLTLPADMPPGAYELRIGLYDPDSGARLPLLSGEDAVALELDFDVIP